MSAAFLSFFYALRANGVSATTHNWLAFLDALCKGLHDQSLDGFYWVGRAVLCADERQYDGYDRAFAQVFSGQVTADLRRLLDSFEEWLRDAKTLEYLDPALREAIAALDLATLREELAKRIAEQKERHDGGSRWIGTGGTSPFGRGGYHPGGIRIGGAGGSRSALAVAQERRFRAYDDHLTLDTRQIAAALRRLRDLGRQGLAEELDVEASIAATAKAAGELELRFVPPRENRLRVLLLLDVGGSMDPHANLVSLLFSAAVQGGAFRELKTFYFHNCPYSRLYRQADFEESVPVEEVLNLPGQEWLLIVVGDAYMHPGELEMTSGNFWDETGAFTGFEILAKLADRFAHAAWLNPETQAVWHAPSIAAVRALFPMLPLSLAGLDELVRTIRHGMHPLRRTAIDRALRRQ
jgi:uncharacterized protein with von Willebrand factor type A (vWA) domain